MFRAFTKLFKKTTTKKTTTLPPPSLPSLPQIGVKDEYEVIEAGARENPREYHNRKEFIKLAIPKLIDFMDILKESDDEEDVIRESITATIHAVFYEWCLLYRLPKENGLFWKVFLNILIREGIFKKGHFGYQNGSLMIN